MDSKKPINNSDHYMYHNVLIYINKQWFVYDKYTFQLSTKKDVICNLVWIKKGLQSYE